VREFVKRGPANDLGPCLARIRRLFGLDGLASEIDEVAPREWTSGLLQPATREKAAEVDGLKSEARNQPLGELFRFRVVSRRKSPDGRREANSRPIALPLAALTRGPGNGAFAPLSASVPLPTRSLAGGRRSLPFANSCAWRRRRS
jgi:hypothetical protein